MNRLVLIGNGFDMAHGLKTSYKDFIDWYWDMRVDNFAGNRTEISEDCLCKLTIKVNYSISCWSVYAFQNSYFKDIYGNKIRSGHDVIKEIRNNPEYFSFECSTFFETILQSIDEKGWVDIENDYYDLLKEYVRNGSVDEIEELHTQLHFLQDKLVDYLDSLEKSNQIKTDIRQKIYAPFKIRDISVSGEKALKEHIELGVKLSKNSWDVKLAPYGNCYSSGYVDGYKERIRNVDNIRIDDTIPEELLLPNKIELLNFNYTDTAQKYCKNGASVSINQIHGNLNDPSSVIFGYGDELDDDYKTLLKKNENKYLCNIKSIKYLEASNYRKLLSLIESEPYQVVIMGHSCGNSDRTLLNTLFEHRNCVSIKPYYYQKNPNEDNYIEIVQNISRNFTDMKLMRDRVVNKEYCEPLTNDTEKQVSAS